MRLRNKKTGEIPEKIETITYIQWSKKIMMVYINNSGERIMKYYNSLEAFNEEWEDYEESKEYWYYDTTKNGVDKITHLEDKEKDQTIGNYFETEEEAEKAVEKLKAWKRLRNKGIRFSHFVIDHNDKYAKVIVKADDMAVPFDEARQFYDDFTLIFGSDK